MISSKKALMKFQKFKQKAALLNCTSTPGFSTPRTPSDRVTERVEILRRTPLRPCFSESDMNTPVANASLLHTTNNIEYDDADENYSFYEEQESHLPQNNGLNTFQMQMEIVDLRNEVKLLQGSTSSTDDRAELLDLLEEKEEEIAANKKELIYMQHKFDDIQNGLKEIEKERHNLRDKTDSLENKNKELMTHLSNREREVEALSKRCVFQEEKKKESLMLMRKNQDLQKTINEVQGKCSTFEKKSKDLQEKQRNNEAVMTSLKDQKFQKENTINELTASLASSKVKMDTLAKENEQAQGNIALLITEKQTCIEQMNGMQDNNINSQKRIDQLEELLSDQRAAVSSLRTEIITLAQDHKTQMQDIRNYHSQRDEDVATRHKDEIEFLKKETNHAINNLKSQLENKSQANATLEIQMSQKLSDTENLRRELDITNNKFLSVSSEKQQLDQQVQSLQLQHEESRKRIVSLSKSLDQSQVDYSNLTSKTTSMQHDVKVIEEKYSQSSRKEQELSTIVTSLQEEAQQHTKKEQQNQLIISNLRKDKKLLEESKVSFDTETQNAQNEMRKEIENLQQKYDVKAQEYEENTKASKSSLIKKEEVVKALKENVRLHNGQIETQKAKIAELKTQIKSDEMDAAEIVSEFETQFQTLRQDYNVMEQKAKTYADEKNRVENDLQRQMENILRQKSQNEAEMNQLITVLQEDKNTLEARYETKLKDTRLKDHKTITSLVNKLNAKELIIDKANKEIISLENEQNKFRDDYDKSIATLQHNIEYIQIQSEQAEHNHHEAIESIQNGMANKDGEIANLHAELEKVHEVLDERTTLLGDMVEQNKALSSELDEARSLVGELQDESDLYLRSKEKVEFLIHKKEAEFKEKEMMYQKKLREDRQMYEHKVQEVGNYKDLYKEAKVLEKESSEYQKEVVMLKDKIKRQEKYIKKLLENKNSNNIMNTGNRRTSAGTGLRMVKAADR